MLTGNLRTMGLPEILQWISAGRKSGTLELERGLIRKKILFSEGNIHSSWSNDPRESLGQFLIRTRRVSEQQLFKALLRQEKEGRLLGAILVDDGLLDGFPYWYAVTAFSAPDVEDGLPEFESGFNENSDLVYPGPAAGGGGSGVSVYPNPYRAASMFDSRTNAGVDEVGRKLWFTGLPARCRIQVFTLAGDLIKTLEHDNPNSGQEDWDLISEPVRAIATGLYVYVVTDHDTGEVQRGKLVIIK